MNNHQQLAETAVPTRGREARSASLATRFTRKEVECIEAAATVAGKQVREWTRDTLLAAAVAPPRGTEPGADLIGLTDSIAHMVSRWLVRSLIGSLGMPGAGSVANLAREHEHQNVRALLARVIQKDGTAAQPETESALAA